MRIPKSMDPYIKHYIVLGFMLGPRIYGNSHVPWKLNILSAESQTRTQVPYLGKSFYMIPRKSRV